MQSSSQFSFFFQEIAQTFFLPAAVSSPTCNPEFTINSYLPIKYCKSYETMFFCLFPAPETRPDRDSFLFVQTHRLQFIAHHRIE